MLFLSRPPFRGDSSPPARHGRDLLAFNERHISELNVKSILFCCFDIGSGALTKNVAVVKSSVVILNCHCETLFPLSLVDIRHDPLTIFGRSGASLKNTTSHILEGKSGDFFARHIQASFVKNNGFRNMSMHSYQAIGPNPAPEEASTNTVQEAQPKSLGYKKALRACHECSLRKVGGIKCPLPEPY